MNGYTANGNIARDYLEAGRDPNLTRQTPQDVEATIRRILDSDENLVVQIMPDGSIEAVPLGTPLIQGPRARVLSLRELGSDY